jgi:tripartite-type tricarboxylate transporter receptor subunit TctC
MKSIMCCLLMLACLWVIPTQSQGYPEKPIRLVVPSAPGGANDFMARLIGTPLSEALGQSVVVDNRSGAGGNIGSEIVARAPGDGYTLLLGSTQMTVNPHIYPKMPYDLMKDLYPIARLGTSSAVLVVHPSVPVKSVKDLIALAKAKPGLLTYGSSGSGSASNIATEMFKAKAGLDIRHIPFKGNGPAYIALMSGEIDLIFGNKPGSMPHVKSGRLKAIAVTGSKRDPALPDLPTVSEFLPGFETRTWWGVFGPSGMSDAVVKRIYSAIAKVIAIPQVQQRMANVGGDPALMGPGEFRKFVGDELRTHAEVVKRAALKLQ